MGFLCVYSCFSLLLCSTLGLYSPSDDVIQLTATTFDRVLSSDAIWFVEFYAPWCGHCQSLAPEWKIAASALKGVVHMAAVNADEHQSLSGKYEIRGFPTILVFGHDKKASPTPYQGGRQASHIVKEALTQVNKLVETRMGGGSSGDRSSRSGGGGGGSGDDVVELTDNNFDEVVLKSDEPWLVEFFAPWCGHCKSLKPHWERAATELKGTMKVGAVDATVHNRLAQKYGIRGFPTIKFFPAGPKKDDPTEYDGGRTTEDIVRWAQDKSDALLPAPEVLEITSPEVFKEACERHPICVISVLPTLYDCPSECRYSYLNIVKAEAEQHKKQKWGWLWTEALKQPDLEQKFDIGGAGYPTLLAVHSGKMKRATLRGAFSTDGIHDFLRSLLHGDTKVPLFPIQVMPTIETVTAWDGQDAPPLEEEELELGESGMKEEL